MIRGTVLDVFETAGFVFVTLQLAEGEVAIGMNLSDSRQCWHVTGISTVPGDLWLGGRRGVTLRPVDATSMPAIGAELTSRAT